MYLGASPSRCGGRAAGVPPTDCGLHGRFGPAIQVGGVAAWQMRCTEAAGRGWQGTAHPRSHPRREPGEPEEPGDW